MKSPIRCLVTTTATLALLALTAPALADRSIIRNPGNHAKYSFEAEPHGVLGLWGVPGDRKSVV